MGGLRKQFTLRRKAPGNTDLHWTDTCRSELQSTTAAAANTHFLGWPRSSLSLLSLFFKYLCVWPCQAFAEAPGIFSCGMRDLVP